jgi:hypothetical protein
VLAVAFLIAGLGLTLNQHTRRLQRRSSSTAHSQTLSSSSSTAPAVSGHGRPVGTVYRLGNGQLVYVQENPRR